MSLLKQTVGGMIALAAVSSILAFAPILQAPAMSPNDVKPLQVGAKAPNASLLTVENKSTTLKSFLGGKPTVLIFYRGGWCPFCNVHLSDLVKVEGDLRSLGYQIVAISPDLPENLKATVEKDSIPYRLLSDTKAEAILKFGVGFKLDDETFTTYRDKYKLNLEARSGQPHHILPVPSVFILDEQGVIRYVHTNPNYQVRLKGSEVLAAAKAAKM